MAGNPSDSRDAFGWVGNIIEGKYSVERVAGAGGFGVVYHAQHRTLGPVALKCLKVGHLPPESRPRFLEQLLAEGKLLRTLSAASAGIVQVFDAGEATSPNGLWSPYLVLEWLAGHTVAEDLEHRRSQGCGGRDFSDAVSLLDPAARALDVAHGQAVAHRDVKPENLFIANVGGAWTVKVLDFGIAKVMTNAVDLSVGGATTGLAPRAFSPEYGAPEQFNPALGATGPWTDVYALAVVFIEVLSGRRAAAGLTNEELLRAAIDPERRPSLASAGVPTTPAIDRALRRALAVDPRNRFARVGSFWTELTAAGSDLPRERASTPRPIITEVAPPVAAPRGATEILPPQPARTTTPVSLIPLRRPPIPAQRVPARWVYPLLGTLLTATIGAVVVGVLAVRAIRASALAKTMALIPPGNYQLGSAAGDPLRCEESRAIEVKAFLIDRTEVTVADYQTCMRSGECGSTREHAKRNSPPLSKVDYRGFELCNELRAERGEHVSDHPINCVDRDQASAYCTSVGKRLPTDDEWERAVRGPDGLEYAWGTAAPDCAKAVFQRSPKPRDDRCLGPEGTAPVRSGPPSASFALFDAAGNVWEWTSTSCPTAIPYGMPAPSSLTAAAPIARPQDPQQEEISQLLLKAKGAPQTGSLRGGGHEWGAEHLRAWKRLPWPSDHAGVSTGFRCAKDAP